MCDHCTCREFEPIADLTAEHEEILALAWRIAEDPDREGAARLAARDTLVAILDRHVEKEETGLYPELIAAGRLTEDHNGDLEEEHRVLHAALHDGTFDRRDYFALAAHIEEEELELFSSAMLAFDELVWDALTEVHQRIGMTARV